MEKLLEKIENLKQELNKKEEIQEIKKLNLQLKEHEQLLNKIKLYNQTRKEQLKDEIYTDEIYQQYKAAETNLNILILEINAKLKKINSKGKCNIWK